MTKAYHNVLGVLLWIGVGFLALPVRAMDVPAAVIAAAMVDLQVSVAEAAPVMRDFAGDGADDVDARLEGLSPIELDEVTWLARCIYSESDRPHEQELVAWVVRNRVETEYRGRTYREVVLEAKQFSAFNEPSKRRDHIISLSPETPLRSWQRTLEIAVDVYKAPAGERPFSQTVRHFYSPVSMVGGREPHWADGGKALSSSRLGVDRRRFIFFDDVDSHLAGLDTSGPSSLEGGTKMAGRDGGDGFQLKLPKPSGKVSRPKRPSVRVPQNDRRR